MGNTQTQVGALAAIGSDQLKNKHSTISPTSEATSSIKSLGDTKAPQKISSSTQQWPHVQAPGEAKLYADLSLAEFCVAYLVIIQRLGDNLGLTTLYQPGLMTSTFSVSVTVALSSLISPLVLVFGLQP